MYNFKNKTKSILCLLSNYLCSDFVNLFACIRWVSKRVIKCHSKDVTDEFIAATRIKFEIGMFLFSSKIRININKSIKVKSILCCNNNAWFVLCTDFFTVHKFLHVIYDTRQYRNQPHKVIDWIFQRRFWLMLSLLY